MCEESSFNQMEQVLYIEGSKKDFKNVFSNVILKNVYLIPEMILMFLEVYVCVCVHTYTHTHPFSI